MEETGDPTFTESCYEAWDNLKNVYYKKNLSIKDAVKKLKDIGTEARKAAGKNIEFAGDTFCKCVCASSLISSMATSVKQNSELVHKYD